ncbi:serine/threonine-protein kinase MARK2-like [Mizuhopecten yessoensis]|uniref:Testis-specific serine/threonine-protein kinase 5 n=1 Tax=Mizuhopecten yessoensis TaxID=6573 RepID=A0A210PXE0_MIZYE|nr:serine/threonine-protein kinase MARK2-like [Mizuhopecten yessoensis]OWF41153.1 Testis-specific serine/threonine-protein kinase 5 [Mizuhopecten yessoensis]
MKNTTMRGFAEKRHKISVLNHYKRMVDQSDKPGKSASIFEHKSKSQSDRTTDLVNADCINHGYRLADILGEGAYAKVKKADIMPSKLARNQTMADIAGDSGQMEVAIKIIDKKQVPKDFLMKFLPRELANHLKIPSHPNIVRLYEQFSSQNHVYMVMEYCSNGDLLDLINKHIGQNQKGIGEETTRKIFLQICSAVQHLHKHLLVHRDLKCENILLDENMNCKLTDFGFSCKVATTDTHLKTSCGSYAYTAPEVIRAKPYDGFRSDIWSLGIILFAMVNGRLPFNDNQLMEMEEEMKMQRLKFERSVSFDCMVLIRKILQYHPSVRPPLDEVIDDKWLTGNKPIPRQVTKPKWTNPYKCQEKVTPDIDILRVDQTSAPRRSKPICFKASPNKGHSNTSTRTVTLNQAAGETVTLKSRRVPRPGPKLPLRPNTWPKTAKDQKDSGTGAASRKPNFRYIAQLVMMNKDKLDPSPTPCSGKEGVCKQMPLWFMYNKLFRDQCKADSASGGDSKCTKSGKPNSAVKAWETAKVDSNVKPNPDSKSKSNCPSRSGSAGKITTPKARVGSTGSKPENTENKRCGFPQRSYAKKVVTANTRNGTVKFPVEGSTKQMTPKSANFILGRTRVTVTTASPGISKSAVTSHSKAKETACTPRATEVTPHGEGYKPKVEPKLKFEEELSSLLSPSELQLLPPLMGQIVKHHEGEVRQYQGNRRMSFCPRMKKHRQRVIVHSCT